MSGVSEWIVREYFESLGYLVIQPKKHVGPGRREKPEDDVDLLVLNPQIRVHKAPEHLVWSVDDLKTVCRAVIGVKGWHSETFYGSTFDQTPDIFRFAEQASIKFAEKILGPGPMAKILCLPKLPAAGEIKEKSMKALREKGIDGVISFETLLAELIARVDTNKNYEKSDLLQIIRILKNYDFLKDSQMELFGKRKRRRQSRAPANKEDPSPPSVT